MWPRSTRILRFVLLLLLANPNVYATKITSTQCGNWSDAQTWNPARIPVATDTILIRHFVSFDTSFVSISPGMLHVEKSGTLCGLQSYNGHFWFEGPVYLRLLIHSYGNSISDSLLNVRDLIKVQGSGGYAVRNKVCVGCSAVCSNCTAVSIPIPGQEEPKDSTKDSTIIVLPTCDVSFPNLLLRRGTEKNRIFKPSCDSTIRSISLIVYNRWGRKVYEKSNDANWWNGTDNSGNLLTDGIYFYTFLYTFLQPVTVQSTQTLSGWVKLIHDY